MTTDEKFEKAAAELRALLPDANLREMVALARDLVEATRDALREHVEDAEEDEPDELSEEAARKLTGALDEIDEADDDMTRAGWQEP